MCVTVRHKDIRIVGDMSSLNERCRVDGQRMRSGMCWFGATCFAVMGFVLVLAGITASAGSSWLRAGLVFVLLAGAALIGMAVLMAFGFRAEHHDGPPGDAPMAHPDSNATRG